MNSRTRGSTPIERTVTLTFENDGVTVHKATEGFEGKDCEALTEFIERALGATDVERTHTAEYYNDRRRDTEEGLRA